jgi:hypothetical protein
MFPSRGQNLVVLSLAAQYILVWSVVKVYSTTRAYLTYQVPLRLANKPKACEVVLVLAGWIGEMAGQKAGN